MTGRRRWDPEAELPYLPEQRSGPDRAASPRRLADVLVSTTGKRRGWTRRLEGARIYSEWAEIAGDQLSGHSEPVRLAGGVLVVRADSSAWATQLRYLTGELAERANAVLGEGRVSKITIVTGPLEGTASDPEKGL